MSTDPHLAGLEAAGLLAPPDGPSPLTARFFTLLVDAEARYGPRDRSWEFGGISYRAGGGPATMVSRGGQKFVFICLTQDAIGDEVIQTWQLAHEVVHLLSPSEREETTVFEEGLASYNQFLHSSGGYTGENLFSRAPLDYQYAFETVRPLIEAHPNGVLRMRAECIALSPLNPGLICRHFPSAKDRVAHQLCQRFYESTTSSS